MSEPILHDLIPVGSVIWRPLSYEEGSLASYFPDEDRTLPLRISLGRNFSFEPTATFCKFGLVAFLNGTLDPFWNSVILQRYNKDNKSVVVIPGPKVGDGKDGYLKFCSRVAQKYCELLNAKNEPKLEAAKLEVLGLKRVFSHQTWKQNDNGRPGMCCKFIKFDGWE